MDLNQLSVLVGHRRQELYETGLLKQPKSRVSRRIATLERELGVALLYRTTRRFSPTEAGMTLYRECRDHIYALEGASRFAQEHSKEVLGVLKISVAEDMGTTLLGPVIDEVTRLHPGLLIDAQLSNAYVDLVREGFDLAIRIGELEDTSLMARKIGQTNSFLVASPQYLDSAPRIESLKDLAKHPTLNFIFGEAEEDIWRLRSGSKRKTSSNPFALSIGQSGSPATGNSWNGVALVPSYLCLDAFESGKLKRVLGRYSTEFLSVSFVWPSQRS